MAPAKLKANYPTHKDVLSSVSTSVKKSTITTTHPHRPKVNIDKHCSVTSEGNSPPRLKPLRDCQTHSKIQKQAIVSRTPLPKVDLDKQCGAVVVGSPCPKLLRDCQTHSRVQKRAVAGRSCSYDMLIVAPAWTAASQVTEPAENNGEGSYKDWQRVQNQIEKERVAGWEKGSTGGDSGFRVEGKGKEQDCWRG
jgi:hypothetical protein